MTVSDHTTHPSYPVSTSTLHNSTDDSYSLMQSKMAQVNINTTAPSSVINTNTCKAQSLLAQNITSAPLDNIPDPDANKTVNCKGKSGEPIVAVQEEHDVKLIAADCKVIDTLSKVPQDLIKFWHQRKYLFSKWDDGIWLDRESWFSVTPENIARKNANRLWEKGVRRAIDFFAGPGGNTIQLACRGMQVVHVDIVKERLVIARHNAKIYGVEKKITFVHADSYEMMEDFDEQTYGKMDAVFISPPWGGPEYRKYSGGGGYDMSILVRAINGTLSVSPNVSVLVPRTTTRLDVSKVMDVDFELEANEHRGRTKTKTLYFGNLMQ